jgi:uncharacterized protein
MDVTPQVYTAKVMHKRMFPKVNHFTYGVYYVALPLPALLPLPSKLLKFHNKDHGSRDGSDLNIWARKILADYGITNTISHITLISMPRALGYVFNPVSFFMCFDTDKLLRAVICEVNNTFGESHSYVCARADHAAFAKDELFEADKIFHVSPFLPRNGHYKFRFSLEGDELNILIDYYNDQNNKQLLTALTGKLTPLNASSLRRVFWSHPLLTIKVIFLIHWQALKIVSKGIRYITKPKQLLEKISVTRKITKI